MPLVKGDSDLSEDDWSNPQSSRADCQQQPKARHLLRVRIRNTKKLLRTAAVIMSVMLISSSVVTSILIPAEKFADGAEANGRAIAYLAHAFFGDIFGTVYDLSTIFILWFAGASAMAGLLSIVPRYLPRYGMAPEWARAARPLIIVITVIAFAVTVIFRADVDAQGGAYATGVAGVNDVGGDRGNGRKAKEPKGVASLPAYCVGLRLHDDPKHPRAT